MVPSTEALPGSRKGSLHDRPEVLVVDDDPMIVDLLRETLETQGFRVSVGYDGQMAIQLARRRLPALIVLDIHMPMTNGLKAFSYIRQMEATRQIPVIFLSGEVSQEIYPIVQQASRVAFQKKPMDLEGLTSLIRQFIAQYPVL